jgi:hypothetical protein
MFDIFSKNHTYKVMLDIVYDSFKHTIGTICFAMVMLILTVL